MTSRADRCAEKMDGSIGGRFDGDGRKKGRYRIEINDDISGQTL